MALSKRLKLQVHHAVIDAIQTECSYFHILTKRSNISQFCVPKKFCI